MDKVRFPYRSPSHLVLLHIVAESGSWKKQGLSVEYDFYVSPEDAHELLHSGKVEFISGNHITPYIARARGDDWTYLGQTANYVAHFIVVKKNSKIRTLEDLRGKSLTVELKGGPHIGLNAWLILRQNGLDNAVEIEKISYKGPLWEAVAAGEKEAVFVNRPHDLLARRQGLGIVPLPLLPMTESTTVSTTAKFARENGVLVKRFLKGLADGIKFFKADKKRAVELLTSILPAERGGGDREIIEYLYEDKIEAVTETLYPTVDAIANVYAEACHYDSAAKAVNPLELWDLHFLRELRDAREL